MIGSEAPIWVIDTNPFAPKVVGTIYEKTFSHCGIATEGQEKPVSITEGNEVYIMSIIASSRRRRKLSRQKPHKDYRKDKGYHKYHSGKYTATYWDTKKRHHYS